AKRARPTTDRDESRGRLSRRDLESRGRLSISLNSPVSGKLFSDDAPPVRKLFGLNGRNARVAPNLQALRAAGFVTKDGRSSTRDLNAAQGGARIDLARLGFSLTGIDQRAQDTRSLERLVGEVVQIALARRQWAHGDRARYASFLSGLVFLFALGIQ